MPWLALLLPALAAALALASQLLGLPALFWTGTGLAIAAAIRRIREGGTPAATPPGIAFLCGGTFVHPWYFGLGAGLCVWAGFEVVRVLVKGTHRGHS